MSADGSDAVTEAGVDSLAEIGLPQFPPYLMNRVMGRYNASLREVMSGLGITTPQMRALAVLSVRDGLLIRELAVFAVVEQSTLSRALDRLDRDGMIRREPDAQDSRATRIFLTDAGRAAHARIWPHMAESYRQMFRGIDAEEEAAFVVTLQKILANVRHHDI